MRQGEDRSADRITALAIGLLACVVYLNALPNDFTFDSIHVVQKNPLVKDGLWAVVSTHYWAGSSESGDLYRPVTMASYWLNYRLAGADPRLFNLVNILLHGAVTGLFVILASRLAGPAAGAAAGILFATHPVHTEAVASVVGRADLLAALFVIAAWLQRKRPVVSCLLFLCGLGSKESAIALPALLLAEDLIKGRGLTRRDAARYLPYVVPIAIFLIARSAVIGPPMSEGPFGDAPIAVRLMTAIEAMGHYIRLTVYPMKLSADYRYNQIPLVVSPLDPRLLASLVGIALCGILAWVTRRRQPAAALGILVFFAALAPVSNILIPIGVVLAERLLYLPSAGFCLAAGAGIALLVEATPLRRLAASRLAAACLVAALPGALFAARAWTRTPVWRSQLTLFEATVKTSPNSALAHINLGSVYQSLGRLEEAEAEYRRAIAIGPDRKGAHHNLGTVLEATGRVEEAIEVYREAVRIDPADWETATNLGRALLSRGRSREAIPVLEEAVKRAGDRPIPMGNLAAAYLHAGDPERARRLAERVLASHPGDAAALRVLDAIADRAP